MQYVIEFTPSATLVPRLTVMVEADSFEDASAQFKSFLDNNDTLCTMVSDPGSGNGREHYFEYKTNCVFGWEIWPMDRYPRAKPVGRRS